MFYTINTHTYTETSRRLLLLPVPFSGYSTRKTAELLNQKILKASLLLVKHDSDFGI